RVESLRGNVNTRLSKLDDGNYDAIVLAAADLERLGLGDRMCQQFTPDEMLPAAAQGVIGIECLASNTALIDVLAELDHDTTVQTTNHERSVAAELQAGCQSPVATYATVSSEIMTVTALVALPDGSESVRERIEGRAGDNLGSRLAARLIDRGAREMLDRAEAMSG
ncbi:MAG: hydroxymethylbilane synthase, partial [Woeseiaceae bacterium]